MIESKEDLAAFLAVKAEKQAVGFVCPLVTAEEVRAKLDEAERQRMIAILREEELRKVAERKQEELAAALDTVTAPYAAAFDAIAMPEGAAEVGRLTDSADESSALETWPTRIWLQHGGEEIEAYDGSHDGAITWCEDHINRGDVEYIRADRLTNLEAVYQAVLSMQSGDIGDVAEYTRRSMVLAAAMEAAK